MAGRNIIVSGLITGALVGITAGVLLAPKSGRVTRRFVKGKTNDFKDLPISDDLVLYDDETIIGNQIYIGYGL